MELIKPQKKIARKIIEKGLMVEFERGLSKIEALITKWKSGTMDNREAYQAVYGKLVEQQTYCPKL